MKSLFFTLVFFSYSVFGCDLLTSGNVKVAKFDSRIIKLIDKSDPNYYAEAKLAGNTLVLDIDLKKSNNERSQNIRGSKFFELAMNHFGDEVKKIKGSWVWGDNLDNFNVASILGSEPEEAVKNTWAYEQAKKFGFTDYKIVDLRGEPGEYTFVIVIFEKEQAR